MVNGFIYRLLDLIDGLVVKLSNLIFCTLPKYLLILVGCRKILVSISNLNSAILLKNISQAVVV